MAIRGRSVDGDGATVVADLRPVVVKRLIAGVAVVTATRSWLRVERRRSTPGLGLSLLVSVGPIQFGLGSALFQNFFKSIYGSGPLFELGLDMVLDQF